MKNFIMLSGLLFLVWPKTITFGQLSAPPHLESLDSSDAPPAGWLLAGFEISTSVPHSAPHCLLAKGNIAAQSITTEEIDLSAMMVREIRWHERRSGSALPFRLSVSYIIDDSRFHLATFDSISVSNSYRERIVNLTAHREIPDAKGRFEFRIEPDSVNSTGVLRIDDIRLIIEIRYDVSITAIMPDIHPLFVGEEHTLYGSVTNNKSLPAEDVQVEMSVAEIGLSETVYRQLTLLPSIPAGDSVRISTSFRSPRAGSFQLHASVMWPLDQDESNDTSSVPIDVGYAPSSMIINEFMFAPQREDEPEWIELYNPGPHIVETVHLFISDKGTQQIQLSVDDVVISPGEYAVITANGSLGEIYDLTGVRTFITHFPSLNNTTPDAVVIRDMHGTTLDSIFYDPSWSIPGSSLERRDWMLPSDESSTWLPSGSPGSATPGRRNSVQRASIDGAIQELSASWSESSRSTLLALRIVNAGRTSFAEGSVRLSFGSDDSGTVMVPLPGLIVPPLSSGDETTLRFEWGYNRSGMVPIQAHLMIPGDLNENNDSGRTLVSIPYPHGSLLVNEIMFDPSPGECEWVEILNVSEQKISLTDWTHMDLPSASGSRTTLQMPGSVIVPAEGIAVIAGDSSLFERYSWLREDPYRERVVLLHRSGGLGLNADRDGIILSDQTGRTIDSVVYDRDWHNPDVAFKGRSLERIRKDLSGTLRRTWTSAPGPDRASPGKPNLALPPEDQSTSHLVVAPNPFSPDGDGHDDLTFITFSFNTSSVFVRARLFDDSGRKVRSLSEGALFPADDLIVWDGRDERGKRVEKGPYILFLEAWNGENSFSAQEKQVVVVAR